MDAPKSIGEPVGTVARVLRRGGKMTVSLSGKKIELCNGDGFSFIGRNSRISGFRGDIASWPKIEGKDVPDLREGMILYRNIDASFEKAVISSKTARELAVSVNLNFLSKGIMKASAVREDGERLVLDFACPAEEVDFPDDTFDVITICQCIWYLDAKKITKSFARMLKPGGKLLDSVQYDWYKSFIDNLVLQASWQYKNLDPRIIAEMISKPHDEQFLNNQYWRDLESIACGHRTPEQALGSVVKWIVAEPLWNSIPLEQRGRLAGYFIMHRDMLPNADLDCLRQMMAKTFEKKTCKKPSDS